MPEPAPKWQTAIESALSKFKTQTLIQVATVDTKAGRPIPHVRTQMSRGFISPSNNPNLPILVASTDVRAPKVSQIITDSNVEVVWWIEGTKQQFRLNGTGHIISSPSREALGAHFVDVMKARSQTPEFLAMERFDKEVDWESKRVEYFRDTVPPTLKASWAYRPAPGSRLKDASDPPERKLERVENPGDDVSEDDENYKAWKLALETYALILIEPIEVDVIDLGVVPNTRFVYKRDEKGLWEEEELVP